MAKIEDKEKTRSQRKLVSKLSKETGLSGATLTYALHFGIMGLVNRKPKRKKK